MRFAAPLILALFLGCGGQPHSREGFAPTQRLYFEVNCPHPGPHCQEAKQLLELEIPKYKYTFTPLSSRKWPYYRGFPLDADVPTDSLLPPHTQLHQLSLYSERSVFDPPVEYLIRIELYTANDTRPDYMVNIFQRQPSGWVLTGTSGPQVAVQRPGMSLSMPEILLHSVIRYSFK